MNITFTVGESTLGAVLVASSERGLCAVLLGDESSALIQELERCFAGVKLARADTELALVLAQLMMVVEDPGQRPQLTLDLRGTPFQRRVWQALLGIPVGKTVSYAELACAIGAPKSARAVAQACARNSLAVVIPCHRIVRSDGALSGYRWGVERKRQLLEREQQVCG